jgi:hypothetical protein
METKSLCRDYPLQSTKLALKTKDYDNRKGFIGEIPG